MAKHHWLGLLKRLYPNPAEHEHILKYFAFKHQYPGRKVHHALVLGGEQGTGKDSLLAPLSGVYGGGNYFAIDAGEINNTFQQGKLGESVMVQLSEAFAAGKDGLTYANKLKKIIGGHAGASDVDPERLHKVKMERANEKYTWSHVVNVKGVVIDTNYKDEALRIEPGDRRYFVVFSPRPPATFLNPEDRREHDAFFDAYYKWNDSDTGWMDLAVFFDGIDLSDWNPATPPPETQAKRDVINAQRSPEEVLSAIFFEDFFYPEVLSTEAMLMWAQQDEDAPPSLKYIGDDRSVKRKLAQVLVNHGYTKVDRRATLFGVKTRAVYVKRDTALEAAEDIIMLGTLEAYSALESFRRS